MEVGSRKVLHFNVTAQPSAEWTLQQFREAIPCDHYYRFLIVDRDSKFSEELRKSVRAMGVKVLRTPRRTPQANAYCERLIDTTRRECLDFLIPLSEPHLRRLLRSWVTYYNRARPHSSLGPNVPDPPAIFPSIQNLTVTTFRSVGASSRHPFLVACTTITGSTLPLERGIRPRRHAAVSPGYSCVPRSSEKQVRLGRCLGVDSLRVD